MSPKIGQTKVQHMNKNIPLEKYWSNWILFPEIKAQNVSNQQLVCIDSTSSSSFWVQTPFPPLAHSLSSIRVHFLVPNSKEPWFFIVEAGPKAYHKPLYTSLTQPLKTSHPKRIQKERNLPENLPTIIFQRRCQLNFRGIFFLPFFYHQNEVSDFNNLTDPSQGYAMA